MLASSNVTGSLQLEAAECLDIATAGNGLPDTDPDAASTPDDLAYVIYTSGSTGKPKGVLVTHANVSRASSARPSHWFAFGPHDVWTLFHSYAFDFSVWELWGALLYGGRLVIVPYWVSRDPAAFRKLLVDERVTVLNQTPSAFRQLIQADLAEAPAAYALREVIFGGEALELQTLKPWFERYGDAKPRLVNMYGITETTVHVTYRPITRADVEAGRGSVIGEPIPDLYIRLLDERGEPVPVGVPGEIWVGGAGVAHGYLNRPELTAERFVADPFDPSRSARLYRAGDLARRLPDGDLEFLGRIDAPGQDPRLPHRARRDRGRARGVPGRGATPPSSPARTRQATSGSSPTSSARDGSAPQRRRDLRTALADVLPGHMIPAHFVALPALPLNANGKLDRAVLPAPQVMANANSSADRAFVEPRSENRAEDCSSLGRRPPAGTSRSGTTTSSSSAATQFSASRWSPIAGASAFSTSRRVTCSSTRRSRRWRAAWTDARKRQCRRRRAPSGTVALTPIQHWFFEQDFSDAEPLEPGISVQGPERSRQSVFSEQAPDAVCEHHDALRLRFRKEDEQVAGTSLPTMPRRSMSLGMTCPLYRPRSGRRR